MASTVEHHAITIHCPCGRRGSVAGRFAGRKVRCTGCGEAVRVPAPVAARAEARAHVAALASAPTAPAATSGWGNDGGLDLLPAVERHAPDWEARLRPALRDEARELAGDRAHTPTPPSRARRRARGGDESRRDVDTEAHLRALAFWQLAGGALGILGALLFALVSLGGEAPAGVVLLFSLVSCAASAVGGALGYFLWTYHAPARIIYMVLSGLATLGHLVQLVVAPGLPAKVVVLCALAWSTAIFLVVAGARAGYVCTADYRQLVVRTPSVRVRWWASPFFYLPIVFTVLAIGAVVLLVAAAAGAAF